MQKTSRSTKAADKVAGKCVSPMKIKLISISLLGLVGLFGLAGLNSGCTTARTVSYDTNALGVVTGITNTEKHLDMTIVCPAAMDIATVGTSLALQYQPQYRPAFVAARDGLRLIAANAAQEPADFDDVMGIINALPTKSLQGTNGNAMLIGASALTILRTINGQILRLDKNHVLAKDVGPFAQCIANGMTSGLGEPVIVGAPK